MRHARNAENFKHTHTLNEEASKRSRGKKEKRKKTVTEKTSEMVAGLLTRIEVTQRSGKKGRATT